MISLFKHKGLELFFTKSSFKGIPAQYAEKIERILDRLKEVARLIWTS